MHLGGIAPRDQQLLIEISEQQNTSKASNTPKPLSTSVIHYVREWKGKKYDVTKFQIKSEPPFYHKHFIINNNIIVYGF